MKIAIVGHGFVGKALENGLRDNVEALIIDPIYNNNISNLSNFSPNIIFLCLPTPMNEDGSQDISIVIKVIDEIKKLKLNSTIVLKSTILPNHIEKILSNNLNIVVNPEFLTEKNALQDFIDSDLIILGGKEKFTSFVASFYKNNTLCKTEEYVFTDEISAAMLKYTVNTFLANKSIFFNELHDLFKNSGSKENWKNFISAISKDSRIGSSHMQVPGPDGRYGFGGACFPKDLNAFVNFAISKNVSLDLLETVIKINNNIRGTYKTITNREKAQNINFSSED